MVPLVKGLIIESGFDPLPVKKSVGAKPSIELVPVVLPIAY